jgi:hypothetical protein
MNGRRNAMFTMMMVVGSGLVIASAALLSGTKAEARADAGRASFQCSDRTLLGVYGGSFEGRIPIGPSMAELRGLVRTHFDGRGNLTQEEFTTLNGVAPSQEWRQSTGSYQLNSDCTGTAEIFLPDGTLLRQHWMVVDGGREILAIVEGTIAGGIRRRID